MIAQEHGIDHHIRGEKGHEKSQLQKEVVIKSTRGRLRGHLKVIVPIKVSSSPLSRISDDLSLRKLAIRAFIASSLFLHFSLMKSLTSYGLIHHVFKRRLKQARNNFSL